MSTQYNAKLLYQLKGVFRRTIKESKYQSKVSTQIQNRYLGYSIDPSFHGMNRRFVLLFENETDRIGHTRYYLAIL